MTGLGLTGSSLLVGLSLAVASTLLVVLLRAVQRPWLAAVLALAAAMVYYRASLATFAVVGVLAFLGARWLATRVDQARRWRAAVVLIFILAAAVIVGHVSHAWALDMWLALRLVTLFWEVGAGLVVCPSLPAYTAWLCLPWTLAGPLLRLSEFQRPPQEPSFAGDAKWWRALLSAGWQLSAGLVLGVAGSTLASSADVPRLVRGATLVLVTGPIGFYLTFAGYYRLMELLARPAGLCIPESFCRPYGRENIAAFWSNWNMTATRVFRDYLFYNRWGFRRHHVFVNVLVLFTLVGLWHGANPYWTLWGFLHGVLFCAFLIWRRVGLSAPRVPLRGTAAARAGARLLTYVSVCACWYIPNKLLTRI